jgi:hypothetical protein
MPTVSGHFLAALMSRTEGRLSARRQVADFAELAPAAAATMQRVQHVHILLAVQQKMH